jgi:hypothetical protein
MNSRELVIRTIRFQGAERLPHAFPEKYGSDFGGLMMKPHPDRRPPNGLDEWGGRWESAGNSLLGQIKDSPL